MAYESNLYLTDPQIESLAEQWQAELDSADVVCGLLDAPLSPDPETSVGDLSIPDYEGYEPEVMEGLWNAVQKDQPGMWSFNSQYIPFVLEEGESESTPEPVDIYGAYLALSGELRIVALAQDPPVILEVGKPVRVRWTLTVWGGHVFASVHFA